jgi:hypothetical protein
VHAVGIPVAVRVELGLDPQLLADPLRGVRERFDDLGLAVDEDGLGALGHLSRRGLGCADGDCADQREPRGGVKGWTDSSRQHRCHPGVGIGSASRVLRDAS